MGNIFSSKSFMARFGAPMSTGPAKVTKEVTETFDKDGDGTPFQKEDLAMLRQQQPAKMQEQEGPAKAKMDEVVITPKTRREKKGKKNRLKSFEGETSEQAKQRRGENKQNRKDARKEKTAGKIEKAKAAAVESGKKSGSSDETKRQSNKAKRLEKRSKRQEGRAERKTIRNIGYTDRFNTRDEIKASRKKQKESGPSKISKLKASRAKKKPSY